MRTSPQAPAEGIREPGDTQWLPGATGLPPGWGLGDREDFPEQGRLPLKQFSESALCSFAQKQ